MLYSENIEGIVYVEIYRNAAVSEADILDLYRTALHDGMGIRTCQWDSVCAVYFRHDLGIGTAGNCDVGNCISHMSLRNSDACVEASHAHRSDGSIFVGEGILKNNQRRIELESAAVFYRNFHKDMV